MSFKLVSLASENLA